MGPCADPAHELAPGAAVWSQSYLGCDRPCAMRDPWRLEVVELSMQLSALTYHLTARFPPAERFGLVDQMRRASVSVGSCIAEGCGCGTDPGFRRYLQIALSSLLELEYQTRLAARLGFGDPPDVRELQGVTGLLKRKLVGLKNAVSNRRRSRPPTRADESGPPSAEQAPPAHKRSVP
jgi:four helix bundle protein